MSAGDAAAVAIVNFHAAKPTSDLNLLAPLFERRSKLPSPSATTELA